MFLVLFRFYLLKGERHFSIAVVTYITAILELLTFSLLALMELKIIQYLPFTKYMFTSKSILMNFLLNQRNSIYNNRQ